MNPGPGRWFWRLGMLAVGLLVYVLLTEIEEFPPIAAAGCVVALWTVVLVGTYRITGGGRR